MTVASPPATPPARRSPLVYVAIGCGVLLLCVACAGLAGGAYYYFSGRPGAQQPAVEYILDTSPRMAQPAENDAGTRLEVAQGVLAEIVRPADAKVTAGLRVFGTGAQ